MPRCTSSRILQIRWINLLCKQCSNYRKFYNLAAWNTCFLSLFLSFVHFLLLSISFSAFFSLSASLSVYLFPSSPLFLYISVSFSLSLLLYISHSHYLLLSSVCLFVCQSVFLLLTLFKSIWLFFDTIQFLFTIFLLSVYFLFPLFACVYLRVCPFPPPPSLIFLPFSLFISPYHFFMFSSGNGRDSNICCLL